VAAAGLGNYYQADDEIQLTEALQQAVEDSPETRPLIPRWLWICGGSLICLVGLGLGVWAVTWLTRRSRRQAGQPQAPEPSAAAPETLEAEPEGPPETITAAGVKTPGEVLQCSSCGRELQPEDQFCSACGAPRGGQQ
jgi:hypothetical protein